MATVPGIQERRSPGDPAGHSPDGKRIQHHRTGFRSRRHRPDRLAEPNVREIRDPRLETRELIGGADGMIRGFESIFGDAKRVQIIVSEEAKTYQPEMEWVAAQIQGS